MYVTANSGCYRRKEGCEATAKTESGTNSYRPKGFVYPECNYACEISLTLKASPYTTETFAYDSNPAFAQISTWEVFFDNSENEICPMTLCELMTSDCA